MAGGTGLRAGLTQTVRDRPTDKLSASSVIPSTATTAWARDTRPKARPGPLMPSSTPAMRLLTASNPATATNAARLMNCQRRPYRRGTAPTSSAPPASRIRTLKRRAKGRSHRAPNSRTGCSPTRVSPATRSEHSRAARRLRHGFEVASRCPPNCAGRSCGRGCGALLAGGRNRTLREQATPGGEAGFRLESRRQRG